MGWATVESQKFSGGLELAAGRTVAGRIRHPALTGFDPRNVRAISQRSVVTSVTGAVCVMPKSQESGIAPLFVVTLARSGSTLLRYLLDTHPDVVCPSELDLADLLHHTADTWNRTLDGIGDRRQVEAVGPPPYYAPEAYDQAREVVAALMARCARATGATVFCDKSITTIDHLPVVSRCFPDASFIFLYRYPLDMIASGIEASRWGFNAYGFGPYVSANSGNFVAALGHYWADRTSKMLEFEKSCPSPHTRIYYERLCDDPAGTMDGLVAFLGLQPDPGLVGRSLRTGHGRGRSDYKVDFRAEIGPSSIGRGALLPKSLLPAQIQRINQLLGELDYPSLASAWEGDLAGLLGLSNSPADDETSKRRLEELTDLLSNGLAAVKAKDGFLPPLMDITFSSGGRRQGTLRLDPESGVTALPSLSNAEDAPLRILCFDDVLLRVAAGDIDFAQALYDGQICLESEQRADARPIATRPDMKALMTLVRAGTTKEQARIASPIVA